MMHKSAIEALLNDKRLILYRVSLNFPRALLHPKRRRNDGRLVSFMPQGFPAGSNLLFKFV